MDVDQISDDGTMIDGVFYVIELALRSPSGKRIVLRTNRTVSCATLEDVRTTMRDIISYELYAGRPAPTEPEACAAAWSVPDGAPIAMACDNLGCALSEGAGARMDAWQAQERATNVALRRGRRL